MTHISYVKATIPCMGFACECFYVSMSTACDTKPTQLLQHPTSHRHNTASHVWMYLFADVHGTASLSYKALKLLPAPNREHKFQPECKPIHNAVKLHVAEFCCHLPVTSDNYLNTLLSSLNWFCLSLIRDVLPVHLYPYCCIASMYAYKCSCIFVSTRISRQLRGLL